MVETTVTATVTAAATSPATAVGALASAISTHWPEAHQRVQNRIAALQAQRANEASLHPHAIFRRNFAGPGVVGEVSTRPAFRVGQLDTELLDDELLDILKQQLWNGLKYFRPSLKETYEPEFLALLRAALFKLTIWDNDATYGAALQNLKYVNARARGGGRDQPPTKSQKVLYGLVTVGGRYLYTRVNLWLLARSNPEDSTPLMSRLSQALEHLSTVHSFATLFSFLLFLKNGRYRTLLDRFLGLRLVAPNRMVARDVSFEYLNRQLVWHAFTEFLLFILPLLRIGRWRKWYNRFIRKVKSIGTSSDETTSSSGILKRKGELSFLPEKTCAICYKESNSEGENGGRGGAIGSTDITNPYEAIPCGHLYCYICITSKITLEEGEGWECLRCTTLVKKCRPWKGGSFGGLAEDESSRPLSSGKKVGFDDDRSRTRTPELKRKPSIEEYYYGSPQNEDVNREELEKLTETLEHSENGFEQDDEHQYQRKNEEHMDNDNYNTHHNNNNNDHSYNYTYDPYHRSPRSPSPEYATLRRHSDDTTSQEQQHYPTITISNSSHDDDDDESQETERPEEQRYKPWDQVSNPGSHREEDEEDEEELEERRRYNRERAREKERGNALLIVPSLHDEDERAESVYDTAGEEEEGDDMVRPWER